MPNQQPDASSSGMATLSVIVNNFNHERFLGEAIDSVLALDMPLKEVVVVDDGSTDGSRRVIEGYGDRVLGVFQDNAGQLAACLNALNHVTGDYTYFLDADDCVAPRFAERLPAALAGRPAKVQFRLRGLDAEGRPLASVFPDYPADYDTRAALADMEAWGLYLCPPTSGNVFRRDVLDRLAATEVTYEKAIDGLALYLAPTMGEIVTLDEIMAFYRLHGTNIHQQHVLSAPRLRREVERTTARWRHFAEVTGRRDRVAMNGPRGMMREWLMMIAVAEDRRPALQDATAFVWLLWRTRQRIKTKAVMTLWALAVVVLPRPMRLAACTWRLSPLNRPKWLNRRIVRA